MNKYQFQLHDLDNKLSILYGMLSMSQQGCPIPEDRVTAIQSRINEIVKILKKEFRLESTDSTFLTSLNQQDFNQVVKSAISKLSRIYYELTITFSPSTENWSEHSLVQIDKVLLYQALENAVENSFKAQAKTVEIKILEKNQQIVLELSDNGKGLENLEEANSDQSDPEACGMRIIKDNMKRMGSNVVYTHNQHNGVTLSLYFPIGAE